MEEIWKDINGYEGFYQVSNFGNVRGLDRVTSMPRFKKSYKRYRKGRILIPYLARKYYAVTLSNCDKTRKITIHRLVAESFIPNPENKQQVNHINGITTDNRVINLEWNTPRENNAHAIKMGLKLPNSPNKNGKIQGENNCNHKLNELQVRIIRKLKGDIPYMEIAQYFNVSWHLIGRIMNNYCWRHLL